MENKKEYLKRFGQNLKRLRQAKGISPAELGRRTEMERSHIARLEGGGTNPTLITLIKLANALDIEAHELLEGYFITKNKK